MVLRYIWCNKHLNTGANSNPSGAVEGHAKHHSVDHRARLGLRPAGAWPCLWVLRRSAPPTKPLPTEWSLTARPVFSSDERRVYRLLKEALPHHVIPVQAAAGAFLPADRGPGSALLVRPAGRHQRHLCDLQPQRPRAGGRGPGQRARHLRPRPADQAVGAGRLPRALSALRHRQPAQRGRVAVAGALQQQQLARPASRTHAWPCLALAPQLAGQARRAAPAAKVCGRTRPCSTTPSSRPDSRFDSNGMVDTPAAPRRAARPPQRGKRRSRIQSRSASR